MLELRLLEESDIPLVERWLYKEHVRKWYEIPNLGITIEDWISEIKEYKGAFQWITYFMVLCDNQPIGLCLYYNCKDSMEEDFGALPLEDSYGIDYFIGEDSQLGKGLGKEMVSILVDRIFTFPDAKRVTADIDKRNTASKKTLLSCGFSLLETQQSRYVIYNNQIKEKEKTL